MRSYPFLNTYSVTYKATMIMMFSMFAERFVVAHCTTLSYERAGGKLHCHLSWPMDIYRYLLRLYPLYSLICLHYFHLTVIINFIIAVHLVTLSQGSSRHTSEKYVFESLDGLHFALFWFRRAPAIAGDQSTLPDKLYRLHESHGVCVSQITQKS